jgi:hypothetical protein
MRKNIGILFFSTALSVVFLSCKSTPKASQAEPEKKLPSEVPQTTPAQNAQQTPQFGTTATQTSLAAEGSLGQGKKLSEKSSTEPDSAVNAGASQSQPSTGSAFSSIPNIQSSVSKRLLLSNLGVTEQLILMSSGANSDGFEQATPRNDTFANNSGIKIAIQRRFDSSGQFKFQIAQSNDDMAYAVQEKLPSYKFGAAYCYKKDEFFSFSPPMDGKGKFFEKSKPTRLYSSAIGQNGTEKSQLIWRKEKSLKLDLNPIMAISSDCNTLAFIGSDPDTKNSSIVFLKRPRVELLGDGSKAPWEEKVVSGRGFVFSNDSLIRSFAFFSKNLNDDLNVIVMAKAPSGEKFPAIFESKKGKTGLGFSSREWQKIWFQLLQSGDKECSSALTESVKFLNGKIYFVSGNNLCAVNLNSTQPSLSVETELPKFPVESFDIAQDAKGNSKISLVVSASKKQSKETSDTNENINFMGVILGSQQENSSGAWKFSLVDEWKSIPSLSAHHKTYPKFFKQGGLLVYARPNLPELTKADVGSISAANEFPIELIQIEPVP